MLSIKEHLILLYCTVDDLLKQQPNEGEWRTSNRKPKLTDAEVLVIALMQSYFRADSLKRTYLLVKANDPNAFKHLPSYKQWINRLHQLNVQTGTMLFDIPRRLEDLEEVYLIDSYPISLCESMRHGRVNLLRDQGAYFGKSSKGWFFGFKLHVLTTVKGTIVAAIMTNGNVTDREGAKLLMHYLEEGALCLADLGYRGSKFQTQMYEEHGVLFITRADISERRLKKLHCQIRGRVETTFGQLWSRNATRVFSRSWLGLWNTLMLKMMDCKLCQIGVLSPL